jgi:ATP-binding cassette, subfamily B, bacterial
MFWMFADDRSDIRGKRLERGLLRRVLRFARPHRGLIIRYVAALLVFAALGAIPPMIYRAIIDDALAEGDRRRLAVLSLVLLGVVLATSLVDMVGRWYSSRIGEGVIYDLRIALFDHVQRMPIAFFTASQTGAVVSRLNNDVIGAQRALTGTLGSLASNLFSLAFAVGFMLAIDWRLTLLALVVLPWFVLLARRIGRVMQRLTRRSMELTAAMNSRMTERLNVGGALLVTLFGDHGRERDEFGERAAGVRDIGIRSAVASRALMAALGLVTAAGTLVTYWVGGELVIGGDLSIGDIVAFAAYVGLAYQPLIQLTNARVDLLTSLVSFERVFEVLDLPNPIVDRPDAIELVLPAGAVELRDVRFAYPSSRTASLGSLSSADGGPGDPIDPGDAPVEVLRGVSFTAEPGRTIALVGPSGAGKTTIASLVCRLYDTTAGQVLVDGHDVRDLTLASLRRSIAVVNQDPHLFHDTIRANLLYADPAATPDRLRDACERARIWDLITSLPEGLETVVGERGYRLSGGEKQRLAIARALLKDPAIVILDEATSHLDSNNEALIQAALHETLAGRTSLVIAHRLSTIVGADEILVLDHGSIAQRGTHAELIVEGGLYAHLYRTQFDRSPDPLAADDALVPDDADALRP